MRWTRRGTSVTLLCAFLLALVSGALLSAQPVNAAGASFYGVNLRGLTSTDTPTATATDTPTSTPTDTPTATSTPTDTTDPNRYARPRPIRLTATDTPTDTPVPANTPTNTPVVAPTPTPIPIQPAKPTRSLPKTSYRLLYIARAESLTGQQKWSNWCGVATVALIANYLHPGGQTFSQYQVARMLSASSSMSEWGEPKPEYLRGLGTRPGVTADISYDFGTDPRSLAEGLTLATGWQYHVKVDTSSALNATYQMVADLIRTQQPISVFVDHGEHSVVVYGVKSKYDPVRYPSSIEDLYVWDPGAGTRAAIQPYPRMEVPIRTWLYGLISGTGADYFKYSYAANTLLGVPLDPDPFVGPYKFYPSLYNHLWIGHFVWITGRSGEGVNADWELNQYGSLIRGLPYSGYPVIPAGYTHPTAPMPINIPPPQPLVQAFYFGPLPGALPDPSAHTTSNQSANLFCVSTFCVKRAWTSSWALALVALLFVVALLVSGALLRPRRMRLATAAVAAGPPTQAMGAMQATRTADVAAPLPGPIIVPTLEADASAQPPADAAPTEG